MVMGNAEDVGDRIGLRGLCGRGRHGWLESERETGQEFFVDIDLQVDAAVAARTDDLQDTVDYAEIASRVVGVIEGEPVRLIETLAHRIGEVCLSRSGVQAVEVTVHKPQAPMPVPCDDVTVTIRRSGS